MAEVFTAAAFMAVAAAFMVAAAEVAGDKL